MNLPTLSVGAKSKAEHSSLDLSKFLVFAPSVLAIAASFLIAFFVVWPKFNEVLKLNETNKTLEGTSVTLRTKADDLSKIDVSKLKTQLTAAELLMPSDKSIFTFIRQVEDIRNRSGVVITNLSVGSVGQFNSDASKSGTDSTQTNAPAAPPPAAATVDADVAASGASVVEMKVSVTSDYKSVLQFLNDLYGMARVTTVKDLTFASSAEGQLSTNMTISSLWQSLPTDLPAIEAPLPTITKSDTDLLARVDSSQETSASVVVPDLPKGRPDIFSKF